MILLIEDNDDTSNEKRIWCIVSYSSSLQVFNTVMNIFYFFVPFLINLFSAIIIIIMTTRQRQKNQVQQTYRQILCEQIQQHKQVLIAPLVLVILAVPRLIISFMTDCMKSGSNV
jgi:sensor domain CHASE-containing protein